MGTEDGAGGGREVAEPTFWMPTKDLRSSSVEPVRSDLEDVLRPASPSYALLVEAVRDVKNPSDPAEAGGAIAVARARLAPLELLEECGVEGSRAGQVTVGEAFSTPRGLAVEQGYLEMCLRAFPDSGARDVLAATLERNGVGREKLTGARSVAEWVTAHQRPRSKDQRLFLGSSTTIDVQHRTDLVAATWSKLDGRMDELRLVQVKSPGFMAEEAGKREHDMGMIKVGHHLLLASHATWLRAILTRESGAKVEGELGGKKLAKRLERALQPGEASADDALLADGWLCARLAAASGMPAVRATILVRYGNDARVRALLDRAALVLPGVSTQRLNEAAQTVTKDGGVSRVAMPLLSLLRPDGGTKIVSEIAVGARRIREVDLTAAVYAALGNLV